MSNYMVRLAWGYLLLNAVPYGLFVIPQGRSIRQAFVDLVFPVVSWVGNGILWFDVVRPPRGTGSGDTSFDWAYLVLSLAVAAILAGVWTRWRPTPGPDGGDWLRIAVRYAVGSNVVAYGLVKLFGYQFPFPGPERLIQPYAESSPMALLWTFMGYAPAYGVFTGVIEIVGGVMLFFRRTTLVGSLIVMGALTNIVMLNLAYDVPVKLFSALLLVGAVALAWPDRRRLVAFLALNQPVEAADLTPPPRLQRLGRTRWLGLKAGLIGLLLAQPVWEQIQHVQRGMAAPPLLHGIYDVRPGTGARVGGRVATHVTFEGGRMSVWAPPHERLGSYRVEETGAEISVVEPSGRTVADVSLTTPDAGVVEIAGRLDGALVQLVLTRRHEPPLLTRRFRWITESPHNR